jgi:hypothetical protein
LGIGDRLPPSAQCDPVLLGCGCFRFFGFGRVQLFPLHLSGLVNVEFGLKITAIYIHVVDSFLNIYSYIIGHFTEKQ